MAKVTSGPYVGFSGSIDGNTYSQMKDRTTIVKRKNRKSTKPRTAAQKAHSADLKLASKFMKPFTELARTGYKLHGDVINQNPYNAMKSQLMNEAIEGIGSHRNVNMSKLLISRGTLPSAAETSAVITEEGLSFSWSTELIPERSHYSDQVLMFAVFRDISIARYVVAGAQRFKGNDLLLLAGVKKGFSADVYISFITNDHTAIADSIYLGQFKW